MRELLLYYVAYGLMLAAGIWTIGFSSFRHKAERKRYCILWFFIWFLLLGLRHPSMGIDLQYGSSLGYLGQFRNIAKLNWRNLFRYRTAYEPGYLIFNKLLGYLGGDYQILLAACALIAIGSAAVWLYRNSDLPVLASVIFTGLPFFLANYSALRQSIALSITLLAYEMIKQRKKLRFILLVLLAASFHRSALIFLLAYPVYWLRVSKTMRVMSLSLPPVVYVLRFPLFRILSRLFKENAQADYNSAITLFLVLCLVYLFCTLFAHYEDREEQGWCNLFLLACLCQAFGGVYSTAMRVGWYFMPYLALLLPRIIQNTERERWNCDQKNGMIMYLVILACFGAFGLYSLSRGTWAMANPYYFFWQGIG